MSWALHCRSRQCRSLYQTLLTWSRFYVTQRLTTTYQCHHHSSESCLRPLSYPTLETELRETSDRTFKCKWAHCYNEHSTSIPSHGHAILSLHHLSRISSSVYALLLRIALQSVST